MTLRRRQRSRSQQDRAKIDRLLKEIARVLVKEHGYYGAFDKLWDLVVRTKIYGVCTRRVLVGKIEKLLGNEPSDKLLPKNKPLQEI